MPGAGLSATDLIEATVGWLKLEGGTVGWIPGPNPSPAQLPQTPIQRLLGPSADVAQ